MLKQRLTVALSSACVCVLIVLSLIHADAAADAARDGLTLSATAIVPALFAFSVLARSLAQIGFPPFITKILPVHRLLGLPECASPVILCGLIGGFPVGAMLTSDLYKSGRLSKGEAARLSAVSSNVSPAFLIGVVGRLFSSASFGAVLWTAQSAAAILAGSLMRFLPDGTRTAPTEIPKTKKSGVIGVLCSSVASSASACVVVTGYIVFFRVVAAVLGEVLPSMYGVMSLVFEFSGGVSYAAKIGSHAACGFTVGLGGLSAIMQTVNYTESDGVSMIPTLFSKLICALVLSVVGWMFGVMM